MSKKTEQLIVKLVTKAMTAAIDIAFVWLAAYVFKPELNSATIWFIAVLYAELMNVVVNNRGSKT